MHSARAERALNLIESFQFLEAYKIPAVKTLIAKTAEESIAFASQLGYPVVMKTLNSQYSVKGETQSLSMMFFLLHNSSFTSNNYSMKLSKLRNFKELQSNQKCSTLPADCF